MFTNPLPDEAGYCLVWRHEAIKRHLSEIQTKTKKIMRENLKKKSSNNIRVEKKSECPCRHAAKLVTGHFSWLGWLSVEVWRITPWPRVLPLQASCPHLGGAGLSSGLRGSGISHNQGHGPGWCGVIFHLSLTFVLRRLIYIHLHVFLSVLSCFYLF